MPTYIMLTTLTAQGVQTLKANPDRLREVNRDVRGEPRIADDQLPVHLERAAAAFLVQEGEHERRHRLAAHPALGGERQRLLDERLDVDPVAGVAREQQSRAAEAPVGLRRARGLCRRLDAGGDGRAAARAVEERQL